MNESDKGNLKISKETITLVSIALKCTTKNIIKLAACDPTQSVLFFAFLHLSITSKNLNYHKTNIYFPNP